jgi:hypothetical protein
LELLFDKLREIKLDVPEGSTIKDLVANLRENHLKEKPELFISGKSDGSVYVFL